ncbi:MAG: TldD/PmbA family protein [Nitrospira sp.]|nr:TldD/PmbA family protein [Nitrospira sp.]MBA3753228.1 TldD/PmbA family protein [Nitrospira sp.]
MTRAIGEQDYSNLAQDLLARAAKHGSTAADVMVADGETLSVQVRMGAVDRLTKAREKRLGLRVFFGQRSASASTSDFSRESLERFVGETCTLAQAVIEDPVSGLPEGSPYATEFPDLNIHDPTKLQTDQQIDLALRTERAAFDADSRITNSEGAECDSSSGRIILANSHGFLGHYANSSFSLSVSPIASDAAGMQRDYWYGVDRSFAKLESPEAIGKEATRRTVRKLGARKVATCCAPVVFDPEVAGSLLGHLCSALSGYALYKGASFLIGQLGAQIAPGFVTIYDDGRMPGGLGTRPFDGEGLPTRKQAVVERGRLTSYLLDTYSGKKLGLSSTGNASRSIGESPSAGPTNFYMVPGTTSPNDILTSVKRGLYVTDLIGFGINMVTGDYSRGASGFWIENGELAYPVEEITIAGNLKQMYANIETIGTDLVFRGRVACPTVKLAEMTIAGQ